MKKPLKATILGTLAIIATPFLVSQNTLAEQKALNVNAHVDEELMLILSSNQMIFNLETPALYTDGIDVTGKTNSANGYTISFNVNNDYNDLKLSNPSVEAVIPSVTTAATEADFPETAWGYSLDSSNYIFKQVPLAPKNIFATSVAGESTNPFTTGIRAKNVIAGEYENELLFTIIANPIVDEDGNEPIVYDEKAKAIIGADNTLNFIYDDSEYAVGDSYGSTQISAVYRMPINYRVTYDCYDYGCYINYENSSIWGEVVSSSIETVNIDPSFYNFKPTSTAAWFFNMGNLTEINGVEYINMSQVKNAGYMFDGTKISNLDLTSWDVGNLINMDWMFYAMTGPYGEGDDFVLDLTGWNTGNVKTAEKAFYDTAYGRSSVQVLGLEDWDMSSLENAESMFDYFAPNADDIVLDLNKWDVSNIKNAKGMFNKVGQNGKNITLRLNNWNMANVENIEEAMQYIGQSAKTITIEMDNLKIPKITNMERVFQGAGFTKEQDGTLFKLSMKNLYAPNLDNTDRMFLYAGFYAGESEIDVSGWQIGNATNISYTFYQTAMYSKKARINASNWDIHSAQNLEGVFYDLGYAAGDFSLDMRNWQDGNITNMKSMFMAAGEGPYGNDKVDEMISFELLGVEELDTSKVTNMQDVLYGIAQYNNKAEIDLDLTGWDMRNVRDAREMFGSIGTKAKSVKLNLSGWVFNDAQIQGIFSSLAWGAKYLELDLTNWTSIDPHYLDALVQNVGPSAEYGTTLIKR